MAEAKKGRRMRCQTAKAMGALLPLVVFLGVVTIVFQGVVMNRRQIKSRITSNPEQKNHQGSSNSGLIQNASPLEYAYGSDKILMEQRLERFPSVEERVKLYMSSWYAPPCPGNRLISYAVENGTTLVRETTLGGNERQGNVYRVSSHFNGSHSSGTDFDVLHVLDRNEMENYCNEIHCRDLGQLLFPALDRAKENVPPVFYQIGDAKEIRAILQGDSRIREYYPALPVLKKSRESLSAADVENITAARCGVRTSLDGHLQPIIWKLNQERHYGRILPTRKKEGGRNEVTLLDIPWENKKNLAVFRGELTGSLSAEDRVRLSDFDLCQMLPRCRLVYYYNFVRNSSLVDAKLKWFGHPKMSKDQAPPQLRINGLYSAPMSLKDLLQYKALVNLEGNDVSSGLKWNLFSNSVVLTPEPTFTSWAMEERLEPWVHYIPINGTDVEEKMQWVIDNDEKAKQIALAGKLWISDMVLHPDAAQDETDILDEILRRYSAHIERAPSLVV